MGNVPGGHSSLHSFNNPSQSEPTGPKAHAYLHGSHIMVQPSE